MTRQPIITTAGLLMALLFAIPSAGADTHDRLTSAAEAVQALVKIPEAEQGIPQDLIKKAQCIVVVPSLKSAALLSLSSVGGASARRVVPE